MTEEEFKARMDAIRKRVTQRVNDPEYERVRKAAAELVEAARAAEIAAIVARQQEPATVPHWADRDEGGEP